MVTIGMDNGVPLDDLVHRVPKDDGIQYIGFLDKEYYKALKDGIMALGILENYLKESKERARIHNSGKALQSLKRTIKTHGGMMRISSVMGIHNTKDRTHTPFE